MNNISIFLIRNKKIVSGNLCQASAMHYGLNVKELIEQSDKYISNNILS